ncbi:UDP-glucose 4-epimerase GalE [Cupriavidus sp. SZY C1]|uniref:UDP-glucose 4-epimerase GalE n=1 Tax=Cupriavidus sp. SZY C1 TaxID=3055037 RepID=UPI0028BC3B10|nr:UDP-glucose 4-epimerase GalE [Cupriavidus sp. SZY C1]MDT6963285.1 UDP-glucose 4-epimerase GalE [Cupriavidus sp. SZY C1]
MAQTLLLTGATGYIASHTWLALHAAGYQVIGLDNLCNSNREVVNRLARITGTTPQFVEGDVRDRALLDRLFAEHDITGAIHFAALKAVGESVSQPLAYYGNNLEGMITLCSAMQAAGVKQLVFSSSATVYGNPHTVPILEDFPLSATNPYGQTKLMGEQILRDLEKSDPEWRIAFLRYFNPVGAHESGLIGEDPGGIPNNLMPYVAQVAGGRREKLSVYGDDYPTVDGTGVRDYIHVCDLADGHVAALNYLRDHTGGVTVNLGTGRGYSVLEVVKAYERASGRPVPYQIVDRRPGDIASCYADPSLAQSLLGWRARHDLDRMCEDSWRWQSMNPMGFAN